MTIIKTNSTAVERNNYDYIRAYAEMQTNNATLVDELVTSYVLIAKNLGITPQMFIETIKNQTGVLNQANYLASQLNSVRPRNAYLGVGGDVSTPTFIMQEIAA
jgi:hypothetical protein